MTGSHCRPTYTTRVSVDLSETTDLAALHDLKSSYRSILVFLFDLMAAAAAWTGALQLRFNFEMPASYVSLWLTGLVILLPLHALACRWSGLYRGIWIFASLPDLRRVLWAAAITTLALIAFMALYRPSPAVPRTVVVLFPILLVVIMSGGRIAYRMWKEHRLYGALVAQGKPVVIVGAGTGGAMLLRELERSHDWRVVGLVDDDPDKWRCELFGRKIFGPISSLPEVLAAEKARHVILAMPSAATESLAQATSLAIDAGAHVFTVPGLEDLMTGRVAVTEMRPVEIEDLLGREPVQIDTLHIGNMLGGKTVLVTGAGGSIGSELCRQLARFSPARLVLLEANEFALYEMEQWFEDNAVMVPVVPLIGDVKDAARINEIFAAWRPQLVFHAAAYKHVPLMEVGNAWQAARNNVLGTLVVAEHAQHYRAERFVLVSTDKAVNPTNVMGATKRLAEMVCEALQPNHPATQFQMVRFGNVLGSAGSVIPKFQQQIARGGPVTVTHPDITRYFMSLHEAAQLVLQAAAMGKGGEIFVLDMGKPIRIAELARNMIRLSGFTEDEIGLEFTGLRAGEKLFEELLADTEETCETHHPKLRIARSRPVEAPLIERLRAWLTRETPATDADVRAALRAWVAEYKPMYEEKPSLTLVHPAPSLHRPADERRARPGDRRGAPGRETAGDFPGFS